MQSLIIPNSHSNYSLGGAPRVIDKEGVLKAIRENKTTSESELAKALGVGRTTVWRRLREISQEELDNIFKELADNELKPKEMVYEEFVKIPEVEKFKNALLDRQVSKEFRYILLRGIWRICIALKKKPENLTIDNCKELLRNIKENGKVYQIPKSKHPIDRSSYETLKRVIRNWFETVREMSATTLTMQGITGDLGESFGKRAKDRLTPEQRKAFAEALKKITNNDPVICSLPYWLYYTGTRIKASLNAKIEDIQPSIYDTEITKAFLVDKGKHKKGREKWRKIIMGDLREKLLENLNSRGKIQQGKIFNGLEYDKLRKIFREAYKKAGIEIHQPNHIWRHTGAQDLLDATGWNYELVASILGWKDTRTLKLCYGEMGEDIRERTMKKAMGIPIIENSREFRF